MYHLVFKRFHKIARLFKYLQGALIIYPGLNSAIQIFFIFRCSLAAISLIFKDLFIFKLIFAVVRDCALVRPIYWFVMFFNYFDLTSDL